MRRCVCFTNWVFLNFTSPTDRVQLGPQAGSWETTALLGTIRWRNPRSFLFLSAVSIPHINMATLLVQKRCHHLGILSHWRGNANLIGLWQAKRWHEHPFTHQNPVAFPSYWNLQRNLSRKAAPDWFWSTPMASWHMRACRLDLKPATQTISCACNVVAPRQLAVWGKACTTLESDGLHARVFWQNMLQA